MTAAVLTRPAIAHTTEDEERWFDLAEVEPVGEQLALDRDSGILALEEQAPQTPRTRPDASLDDVWYEWLDSALSARTEAQHEPEAEASSEPLHIEEARLRLSRSYRGGAAMRLKRLRS